MRFDDLIGTAKPPETPEEMRQMMATIMSLQDLSRNERDAFHCGYIIGLSYAIAADRQDAATELLLQIHEVDK